MNHIIYVFVVLGIPYQILALTQLVKFTFGKLLGVLSKLKIAYLGGYPVLQPLTKEQKLIFKSFSVKCPGGSSNEE